MGAQGSQILENIIQLAELLDDEILKEMEDVSFLELAKAVSFEPFNGGETQPFSKKRARKNKRENLGPGSRSSRTVSVRK